MFSLDDPEYDDREYSVIYADPQDVYDHDECDCDLFSLPVPRIAACDSVLFLWTPNKHLPRALKLIDAWRFEFKSVAFNWTERNPHGEWGREYDEQCLLASRGQPKHKRRLSGMLACPKPETMSQIEALVEGPYVRLFNFWEPERPGWDEALPLDVLDALRMTRADATLHLETCHGYPPCDPLHPNYVGPL